MVSANLMKNLLIADIKSVIQIEQDILVLHMYMCGRWVPLKTNERCPTSHYFKDITAIKYVNTSIEDFQGFF